jgi:hypothetical protein
MNDELEWHLDPRSGPKRILALDGGGVRGLISLGMLERIEHVLAARTPRPADFRLCHYFDLIAGTSTGSIIATALALGMRVDEIRTLYGEICPAVFKARAKGLWRPVYDHRPVEECLKKVLGTEQLQSDKLRTGLMICAKRIDTGSPWVLTNNPRAKFWDSTDGRHKPNKEYELWMLVRASTAAPLFFEPVEVPITEKGGVYDEQTGVFIDGAVGGHNNPSLQALMVATLPSYRFNWARGADKLFIVSLGTGWWRRREEITRLRRLYNWQKASEALAAMIQDTVQHNIMVMQAMSSPRKPWFINGEIEGMRGERTTESDVLSYQRYDAVIDEAVVGRHFNLGDPGSLKVKATTAALRQLGNTEKQNLDRLFALGQSAAQVTRPGESGIEDEDFPRQFDPPYVT